jgi:pimeloyl-ACP methyl ester carboxylesterase
MIYPMKVLAARLSALFVLVLLIEPAQAQPAPKKAFEVEKIPDGLLIAADPELAGKTKAWVWYAPGGLVTGEAEKWMVEQFLAAGISAAGGGGEYGGPNAIRRMNAFYTEMTEKRGYSKKPIVLARSRGGLTCLGWAVEHPDKVGAFAGIYPVCNILGWSDVSLGAYGLKKDSSPEQIKMFNPVDRLKGLAEAKAPLFAVHGDNDKAVPLELNSGLVKERYTALGGTMQLLVAPGAPHGAWKREGVQGDGFFRCQELVDFVKSHARPK